MKNLGKWMLGAAMAIGALGFGANQAQAARIGVFVGGPRVVVPACPGPGYAWVAGYYNAYGVWVPGYWNFVGVRTGVVVVGRPGFYYHRGFYRR